MLKNSAKFNYEDLFVVFGNNALHNIRHNIKCKSIIIDSRELDKNKSSNGEGDIFIALMGSKIDGHSKVVQALNEGAILAVVNKSWYDNNESICKNLPLIIVKNTEIALAELAQFHRNRFEIPIIAVAGSNGKTTTKELIARVLEKKFTTLKTHKNFNNQLGVPLMLLQLDNSYQAMVIEIATNSMGEIDFLSNIVNPTHGIITNIGKEHLEFLGDLNGVELEETALFSFLHKNNKIAFINTDDKRLIKYSKVVENHIAYGKIKYVQLRYNYKLDENSLPNIEFDNEGKKFNVKLKLPGYPAVINATAAAIIGLSLDISVEDVVSALEGYSAPNDNTYGRLLIEEINGVKVINDCYNANPSSVSAALDMLNEIKVTGKKYAVLGDMLELGETTEIEHKIVLDKAEKIADKIFTFGEMFKSIRNKNKFALSYLVKEEINSVLKAEVKKGDLILVKGSRSMKMEEVIQSLK